MAYSFELAAFTEHMSTNESRLASSNDLVGPMLIRRAKLLTRRLGTCLSMLGANNSWCVLDGAVAIAASASRAALEFESHTSAIPTRSTVA